MNKHFQEVLTLAQTGKIDEAFKRCRKLIKKKPRETNYLLLAASLHASNKEFPQVIDYCCQAIKLEPKNISALYNASVAYLNIGDYENALKHSKKLMSLDKKNAKAASNLGLSLWHLNQYEDALSSCLNAISLDPSMATAHNNLGLTYKSLNDIDNAIKHFKESIKLDPHLTDAYYNCGITLIDNDDDSGQKYLDKVFQIDPNYAELHNYNGMKLIENKQTKEAIDHFKKAVTHKHQYIDAYMNLGDAFMLNDDYSFAETTFKKLIEFQPNNALAYVKLGQALLEQDSFQFNYSEAEQCYLKAIELAPDLNDTYNYLATCYAGQGETDKALEYFKKFHEKVPTDDSVVSSMITALERRGDFDEAKKLLDKYYSKNSTNPNILLSYGRLAKHLKQEEEAINALLTIDDSNFNHKLLIEKYHILGKLSQSQKDVENTFFYYKKANDFEEDVFDIDESQEQYNNTKSYFTKEKLRSLNKADNSSALPIFIVGMPRSGTTLTEQILASHPDVYGAGELTHLGQIKNSLQKQLQPKGTYPSSLDNMTTQFASSIANKHINTLQDMSPNSSRIVDKMPHNFYSLGLISLLFPNATIIHCQRSPVDICLSIYFQHFNKQHAYSNDLTMLGKYYHQYADLMNHWKSVLDLNIIDLKYENVINNPEEETRRLLNECKLEWNPSCLNFHKNKRVVLTPSYDQVRQPLYTSSVAKWKKYEHHLSELIESLGEYAY